MGIGRFGKNSALPSLVAEVSIRAGRAPFSSFVVWLAAGMSISGVSMALPGS